MNTRSEPKGMRGPFSPSTEMHGTFAGARSMPLPPHIGPFPPRRFQPVFLFGGGCFNGFFPGFCGSGFFLGSGFWGYGWGCDPFWGCNVGYNTGYYNGGSYGDVIYESDAEVAPSQEFNPNRYAYSPEEASGADNAANSPEVVLFLKDGTVYALTDYWIADGKLYYVTNYGGENSIELDQIDMQTSVDVNHKRGIDITLKPAPTLRNQVQPQNPETGKRAKESEDQSPTASPNPAPPQ
ncbi:MAG: hypothetical protein WB987_03475 [Candidatus Acidiferrales bacterium]